MSCQCGKRLLAFRHGNTKSELTLHPFPGGRAKTWVTLTPAGQRAFEGHLAMLQQMATDLSQGVG